LADNATARTSATPALVALTVIVSCTDAPAARYGCDQLITSACRAQPVLHVVLVSEASRATWATTAPAVAGPLLLTVSVQMPVPSRARVRGQDSFAAMSALPVGAWIVQVKDAVPVVPPLSVPEIVRS
jgi:hypothetical protein